MTNQFETEQKILKQYLKASLKHLERIEFAKSEIKKLTMDSENENIFVTFSDQIIYRFGQLQDQMAKKIFPNLLKILGENESSFIDIFNKLEKLDFLNIEFVKWQELRDERNNIHEYEELEINEIRDRLDVIIDDYIQILENLFIYLFEKMIINKHLSNIIDEKMSKEFYELKNKIIKKNV